MPDPVTWGHLLMLAGLLAGLFALIKLLRWHGQRAFGRGTPQYADGRLARRSALYALAIGIVLFVAGCFTPLAEMAIT